MTKSDDSLLWLSLKVTWPGRETRQEIQKGTLMPALRFYFQTKHRHQTSLNSIRGTFHETCIQYRRNNCTHIYSPKKGPMPLRTKPTELGDDGIISWTLCLTFDNLVNKSLKKEEKKTILIFKKRLKPCMWKYVAHITNFHILAA